ncbi:MAG: ABC transporter transmembrane domain-containing protein [Deinococcaceae bacterium]
MVSNANPSAKSTARRAALTKNLTSLKRLLAFVRPYRWALSISIVSAAISSGLTLVFPKMMGQLVDGTLLQQGTTVQLDRAALVLLAVFAVQAIFNFLRTFFSAQAGEGVVADLRSKLFDHIIHLPLHFFETRRTGEISSRLSSDATVVQGLISQDLNQLITQVFILIGGITLLFIQNVKLTLVMLSVVPLVVIAAAILGRRLRKLSTHFQDRLAEASGNAEESISGIRVVQSFTAELFESGRYAQAMRASFVAAMKRAWLRAWFVSLLVLTTFASLSLVLWYGGRQVLSGALTTGDLVSFLINTLLIAGAIGALAGLASKFSEASGATDRIFDLFHQTNDLQSGSTQIDMVGHLTFQNVSFGYGDRGDTPVVAGVSLTVHPGEVVALVGPSGAGKSTLAALVARFYDPTEGGIFIDQHNIRDLDLKSLRSQIGLVPQETQLFSGTIADNIRYSNPSASIDVVMDAAKSAGAHEFIESFPEAYGTLVGERGLKLSGGQRQRIAIARALLKNPKILILDEATSALDNASERAVQEALDRLMVGRTTLVIAHRLSTVQNADRILVMESGRIVEEGNHLQLMSSNGLYKKLYDLYSQDHMRRPITQI